jgi:hypothetical protein
MRARLDGAARRGDKAPEDEPATSPLMSNGTVGSMLKLRPLFES